MKKAAALAALLLASCNGPGPQPQIEVRDAWARASVPQQASSAAYFTIRNSGGADTLVSVSTPIGNASLHSTEMTDGIMRMRPLDSLDVPANSTVQLKPGGTHVMLMGLDAPLAPGATVGLDLTFAKSGERHVNATVRASGGAAR